MTGSIPVRGTGRAVRRGCEHVFVVRRKDEERAEARRLRSEGVSVRAIAAQLGVAKSSVSVWVRDVPLPVVEAPAEASPPAPSAGDRRCSRCQTVKPLEAFNRSGDGWQWYCRACFKAYFVARGQQHREQSGAAQRRRQDAAREHVLTVLRRTPCADCGGEGDPVVLEFDHLRDKEDILARLVARGARAARLDDEMAKCDVVCVNCHRHRTAVRAGHRRAAEPWWSAPLPSGATIARNVAIAYNELERGCVDCGWRRLTALEFDHVASRRRPSCAWPGTGVTRARPRGDGPVRGPVCELPPAQDRRAR